jgi:uncharacterized metal-binding protein YceD (DUF177 family)
MTSETPDTPAAPALPLRQSVRVESITLRTVTVEVVAQLEQLAPIARHLGLASLEALRAEYRLSRNGDRVGLEGEIRASLHQNCVVTLEPVPATLRIPVKLDFVPESEIVAPEPTARDLAEIDIEVMLNEADPPEPIIGGVIDLGAVTLEFLALGLDPYPRKPGATFTENAAATEADSPFAALARLKRDD